MQLAIIPPYPWALRRIADNMCAEDRTEMEASQPGVPLIDILTASVRSSYETYVATYDGKPVAVFGVALIEGNETAAAAPWLLSTGIRPEWRKQFHRAAKLFLKRWLKHHTVLWNYVHKDSARSIRWIEQLGFDVWPAEDEYSFRYFEIAPRV